MDFYNYCTYIQEYIRFHVLLFRRYCMLVSKQNFTIIELLISIVIIAILFSLLMPAFSESREKARFARWLQFNKQCSNDPTCVINLNFQDDRSTLRNSAQAYEDEGFNAADYRGVIKGDYEWGSGRWNKGKKAVIFDGMSTYIEFSKSKYLDFDHTRDFTIIAWVKVDSTSDTTVAICGKSYTRTVDYYMTLNTNAFRSTSGNTKLGQVRITEEEQAFRCQDQNRKYISMDYSNWYQISMRNKVVNGTQEIQMFINDIKLRPSWDATRNNTSECTSPLTIGSRFNWGRQTAFFKGKMDEFLVYSRALRDSEIKAHYLMGAAHGN